MEYPFVVAQNLNPDHRGGPIVTVTGRSLQRLSRTGQENAKKVLDVFGQRSARAQKLKAPITSFSKLVSSTDQTCYMQHDGNKALGFIKVGKRRLFVHYRGVLREITPLCVLDFYVHESCQRMGVGSKLFRFMLAQQQAHPSKLAYDRPSPKLIAFLRKYYNLTDFDKQNNNYVVFKQYFQGDQKFDDEAAARRSGGRESLAQRPLTARDRFGRKIKKHGGGRGRRHNNNNNNNNNNVQPGQNPAMNKSVMTSSSLTLPSLPGSSLQPQPQQLSPTRGGGGGGGRDGNELSIVQSAAQRSDRRQQQERQRRLSPVRGHDSPVGAGVGVSSPHHHFRSGVGVGSGGLGLSSGSTVSSLPSLHGGRGGASVGVGAPVGSPLARPSESIQGLLRTARQENAAASGFGVGVRSGGGRITSTGFDPLARHAVQRPVPTSTFQVPRVSGKSVRMSCMQEVGSLVCPRPVCLWVARAWYSCTYSSRSSS